MDWLAFVKDPATCMFIWNPLATSIFIEWGQTSRVRKAIEKRREYRSYSDRETWFWQSFGTVLLGLLAARWAFHLPLRDVAGSLAYAAILSPVAVWGIKGLLEQFAPRAHLAIFRAEKLKRQKLIDDAKRAGFNPGDTTGFHVRADQRIDDGGEQ